MDKIAVLIPCYNEARTVAKVVTDFRHYLPEAVVYVYDNNSTDGTDELARKAGAIVRYEHRQGKGNVIRSMFREIDAACYVMVDGDDTYEASHAPEMVKKVLDGGVDMVVGDRLSSTYFTENKRPFHNFGNVLVRRLVNGIFKGEVKDIMTGYRAMSRLFVKSFPVLSQGFEIETEMTIHALDKNFALDTVEVEYRDRPPESVSKLNTVSDGAKVLATIVRLCRNYRPVQLFSAVSGILALVAVLLYVPAFGAAARVGLAAALPKLVLAGFFGLGAVVLFVAGLVLGTLVRQQRQSFEVRLNLLQLLDASPEPRGSERGR